MTDFFKRLLNQPEPPAAPDVPPAEMAAYLRSLDDRQWGRYAFSREPLEGKFTPQQKDAARSGRTSWPRNMAPATR